MKKIFIIVVALLVILGVVYGYMLYKNQPGEKEAPITKMDLTSKTVTVETPTGGGVVIKNPVQESLSKDEESGSVLMVEDQDFLLEYYAPDQSFSIALVNPDIWNARVAAEKRFLEKLGVSQEEACKLLVNLTVPFDINSEASGKNYGLSFCPNGIPLPAKK